MGWSRSGTKGADDNESADQYNACGCRFSRTFQIELLQGRNGTEGDMGSAMLITETTLKELGWDNFEGRKLWDRDVIGVVNEFQYNSMHSLIGPVAFLYSESYYNALNVRLTWKIRRTACSNGEKHGKR